MAPLLVLLFIVVPIAELAVIIQVGGALGLGWTALVLVVDSLIGALLVRAQGRSAWRRFTDTLRAGRPPAREVVDGALVLLGGALLLTPGFITDAAGLALLVPPTRALVRGFLVRRLGRRMVASMTAAGGRRARTPAAYDVDGSAVDVQPPPPASLDEPRRK